jgi:P27 family predicted phage terminase small subunit
MPGPVPKSPERRQRRNNRGDLTILPSGNRHVPDPPDDLLEVTCGEWLAFWTSALSEAVDQATDLPVVRRLFRMRDEYRRADRAHREQRVVEGSMKQPVPSPGWKMMKDLEGQMVALEDRLGLSPKARAQLGITIGAAKRTLDDLNRALDIDDSVDPRLDVADEA